MEVKTRRVVLFDDKSRQLDRFGALLVLVAASIVMLSLVDLYQPVDNLGAELISIAAPTLVGATLLLAARASGLAKCWQIAVDVIVLFSVLALAAATLLRSAATLDPDGPVAAPLLITLLAATTPLVIVRRLVQHRRISRGTMFGAISAYLLLPVAFFYMFLWVNTMEGEPFFGASEPTQVFMYFSLTSLTTIGYGDYTAQSDLGRLLCTAEAMIGQIYLVAFVAMLVGLFAAQWRESRTGDLS
ncbi:MAG: potassium channel family protein [Actinomycetota bacterium]|nr:potassium channel family protein [Actinomycetota bacterium]